MCGMQGNREEELPEVVLACARVSRVDFGKVRPFPAHLDRLPSDATRALPMRYSMQQGADSTSHTSEKLVVANAV